MRETNMEAIIVAELSETRPRPDKMETMRRNSFKLNDSSTSSSIRSYNGIEKCILLGIQQCDVMNIVVTVRKWNRTMTVLVLDWQRRVPRAFNQHHTKQMGMGIGLAWNEHRLQSHQPSRQSFSLSAQPCCCPSSIVAVHQSEPVA